MIVIDSRENKKFLHQLDLMEISYKVEEINVYVCKKCKKIYKSKKNSCGNYITETTNNTVTCDSTEFDAIKTCDITNEDRSFFIEVKRGQDLAHSLLENHIYDQLERMRTLLTTSVLVFEGNWNDLLLEPHNQSRIGQIMSLPSTCAQYGISFIQVSTPMELIKMLKFFDEKSGKEPKLRTQFIPRSKNIPDPVALYMSVPGISEKLAKNIYKIYPIPVQLAQAIMDGTVKKIEKVGAKKLALLGKHLWGELYNEESYKSTKKNKRNN